MLSVCVSTIPNGFGSVSMVFNKKKWCSSPRYYGLSLSLYAKKNVTVIYGIQIEVKLNIKNDTFGNDESNLCALNFGVDLVSKQRERKKMFTIAWKTEKKEWNGERPSYLLPSSFIAANLVFVNSIRASGLKIRRKEEKKYIHINWTCQFHNIRINILSFG